MILVLATGYKISQRSRAPNEFSNIWLDTHVVEEGVGMYLCRPYRLGAINKNTTFFVT